MTVILDRSTDFNLEELHAALEGRISRLAPGPAMTLLAGRRVHGARWIFERLLADESRSDTLRAHALRLLVTLNPVGIESILLPKLDDSCSEVVREAVRALGRVGGRAALESLQCVSRREGRPGREARLAALILAARHGLPGPSFRHWACGVDSLSPGDCAESANLRKARRADFDAAMNALSDDPLHMALDAAHAWLAEGSALKWLFLFNNNCDALLATHDAPALLAILAEWDPSDDRWFEGFLLLADASTKPGQRLVALIDTSGDIVMKGSMTRRDEAWSITLTTSEPTMLQARIDSMLVGGYLENARMRYRSELVGRQKARVITR